MSESARPAATEPIRMPALLRVRCYRTALGALGEAGLNSGSSALTDDLIAELDFAYSVMSAARESVRPEDFALFFLSHLAKSAPRRETRRRARAAGVRYLMQEEAQLSPDLASLAAEARSHGEPPRSANPARPEDGRMPGQPIASSPVSDTFLKAYGELKPAVAQSRAAPRLSGGARPPKAHDAPAPRPLPTAGPESSRHGHSVQSGKAETGRSRWSTLRLVLVGGLAGAALTTALLLAR